MLGLGLPPSCMTGRKEKENDQPRYSNVHAQPNFRLTGGSLGSGENPGIRRLAGLCLQIQPAQLVRPVREFRLVLPLLGFLRVFWYQINRFRFDGSFLNSFNPLRRNIRISLDPRPILGLGFLRNGLQHGVREKRIETIPFQIDWNRLRRNIG